MSRYRLWQLLGTLAMATFLISTCGLALSPFLTIIAADLDTSLAAIANLLSFVAVSWGLVSPLAGAASDRYGRRWILVIAVLTMGIAQIGMSYSHSYATAVVTMILAGLCGGSFTSTVYATVADHIAPDQRGKALGWVMTGQSLAMVFGVPLLALLGSVGGWRGALLSYGFVAAAAAVLVWWSVPGDKPRLRDQSAGEAAGTSVRVSLLQVIAGGRILMLLGAGMTERICFAVVAVYMATYLQRSYGVSLEAVAFGLAMVALGTVSGNLIGGFIADRMTTARTLVYAFSALATASLAPVLLLWQPGLIATVMLGFVYTLTNSIGRPSLLASLSEVPAEVRGTVMGLNVTCASVGWLASAALGGWLVTQFGFAALAVLIVSAGIGGFVFGVGAWWLR